MPTTGLPRAMRGRDLPPQGVAYAAAARDATLAGQIESATLSFEWGPAMLFSDGPAKAQGLVEDKGLMIRKLMDEIGVPEHSVDLGSAYFIPGEKGAASLVANLPRLAWKVTRSEGGRAALDQPGCRWHRGDIDGGAEHHRPPARHRHGHPLAAGGVAAVARPAYSRPPKARTKLTARMMRIRWWAVT